MPTLTILNRPTDPNWQLFSRIFVSPQLTNDISLVIGAGLDLKALSASIGAYGANVGFGPLLNIDPSIGGTFLIYSNTFDLAGGNFSRVYRNPIPLFGGGNVLDLPVANDGDFVNFSNASGAFGLTQIGGTLALVNSTFVNNVPVNVTGTGTLALVSGAVTDSSLAEVPKLTVAAGGVVQVDANNQLIVDGVTNANLAHKDVGFISDTGVLASGTFLLGGTLSYDGPDITSIGPDAIVEELPLEP